MLDISLLESATLKPFLPRTPKRRVVFSAGHFALQATAVWPSSCLPQSTMRYLMRQKLFALTDSFAIKNGDGDEVYRVRGKLLKIGKQLSFEDIAGNELAYIRQKLIAFTPTYEIHRDDRHIATVSKKMFTLLRHRFIVDVPGPDDLEATGNFLDHEYTFERSGRTVARVSKRWFSLTDTYGIETADGEDDVLILASAVVIDMIAHDDDNS